MHGMEGFGGGFGMFFWWIIVIVAIVIAAKWLFDQRGPGEQQESPIDILKRRYAQGEISRDEFQKRKEELQ